MVFIFKYPSKKEGSIVTTAMLAIYFLLGILMLHVLESLMLLMLPWPGIQAHTCYSNFQTITTYTGIH